MPNFNKVFLMGNLTRDPEIRHTPQGTAVAELGIAVNRVFRDQGGQKREDTCFVDVTAWGNQAETIQKYLRKGAPLFVEGRLQYHTWETREGEKRSKLRVTMENFQFIDSPASRGFDPGSGAEGEQGRRSQGSGRRETAQSPAPAQQASENWGSYPNPVDDDLNLPPAGSSDDDVPF